MKPIADCQLYTFIDTAYLRDRPVPDLAQQLCDGGSDLIQLRAKAAPLEQVRHFAEQILPVLQRAGVGLVINDYPELAAQIGAPYCHLGQEDFFGAGYSHVEQLQRDGTRVGIGLSTHAPDQAERALRARPDYLAIGPVFQTPTKPTAQPVTLEYVRWAAGHVAIPWFAIGGVTLQNLDAVLAAGARRVCVVSAILTSAHVAKACQAFKDCLVSAGRSP